MVNFFIFSFSHALLHFIVCFSFSAVNLIGGGGQNATTGFISSRSEPISLATLDKDCFIIPVHSIDRFMPAGIPVNIKFSSCSMEWVGCSCSLLYINTLKVRYFSSGYAFHW